MVVPIDQVEKWYRALKNFYDLATDARYLIEFKLKPGNCPQANIRNVRSRNREKKLKSYL